MMFNKTELSDEQFKKLYNDVRASVAEALESRINIVIENRLQEWFETNMQERFDKVIKEEFNKIIIAKLR
jgi:hypothetical protein